MDDKHNVILFPKWKAKLEEESLTALREKRYHDALNKLNELIQFNISSHEIMLGKLICLMELTYYDDAQELCETLIALGDDYYYQYVHVYLTLLFQTSQYTQLMERVDYERESEIPDVYIDQFKQLYDMSKQLNGQLNETKLSRYTKEFFQAVDEQAYKEQWRLIEEIRRLKSQPKQIERFSTLLTQEQIHPVVKTAIFQWLQEIHMMKPVTVHKLQLKATIIPSEIRQINDHPVKKEAESFFREVEQENPALYYLLEQLLNQYIYVCYPIIPAKEDLPLMTQALEVIGKKRLNLPIKQEPDAQSYAVFKRNIELCEILYSSIIEA